MQRKFILMVQTNRLRKKLFQETRNHLLKMQYDGPGILCPLCANSCGFEDTSVEHVPQNSIGGRRILLTCVDCNNRAGTKYERSLAENRKLQDFLGVISGEKEGETVSGQTIFDGVKVNTSFEYRDGKLNLNILQTHNNPLDLEKLSLVMNENRSNKSIVMSSSAQVNTYQLQLSFLKSALLACFAQFGYTYIFSGNQIITSLRRLLADPTGSTDSFLVLKDQQNSEGMVLDEKNNCVAVTFNGATVIVPWFKESDAYPNFLKQAKKSPIISLKGVDYSFPNKPNFHMDNYWLNDGRRMRFKVTSQ